MIEIIDGILKKRPTPPLIYNGTPPADFGEIGDWCFDGENHLLYGPKTESGWGTGIELGGSDIPDGTAAGQLLYWNGSAWAAGSNILYDETNSRFNINSYPSPTAKLSVLGDTGTSNSTYTIAEFRGNTNSVCRPLKIIAQISSTSDARNTILKQENGATLIIDPGDRALVVGANYADNTKYMRIGNIWGQNGNPGQSLKLQGGNAATPASYAGGALYLDAGAGISGVVAVGTINANAKMGIGTAAPTELLSVKGNHAFILTTTGTPTDRDIYKIVPSLPTTTDASRTGRVIHYVYDYSGARESFRADADGSKATAIIVGQTMFTEIGGIARKVINKTGANSVKGSLVVQSTGTDNGVSLANDAYDCIGVIYDSGVADGSECWMVYSGVAEVLVIDSHAVTRGDWCSTSTTAGRATTGAVPSPPTAAEHFKEIGHALESKAASTDVLFKMQIHFL